MKGVVYCRTREQCEGLARELDCAYYHAGAVDREERLEEWLEEGGLIVATSALGTGVDFPGIVFVLHVGLPYGMIDYAQESGRAGRGGEAVDSVVLLENGEVERRARNEAVSVDKSAMAAFVTTTGCRRGVMSRYLDGEEITCADVDCAACDRCGEGLVDWQSSQARDAGEQQQVRRLLDEVADGCAACWMLDGEEDSYLHSLATCRKFSHLSQAAYDEFRGTIWYEKSSHTCTKCGISQKLCATAEDTEARCRWSNVLVPVVRAAMGTAAGLDVIRKAGYDARPGDDLEEYGRWLGRRHGRRVWGVLMSNAMVVLIRMLLYISNGRAQAVRYVEVQEEEIEELQGAEDAPEVEGMEQIRGVRSGLASRFGSEDGRNVWTGGEGEEEGPEDMLQSIGRQLARWRGRCAVCKAAKRAWDHELADCKDERGRHVQSIRAGVEGAIGRVARSGCYECRAPQGVCNRWEDDGKGRFRQMRKGCQFTGVMTGAIFGISFSSSEVRREWRERLEKAGIDAKDFKALGTYLKVRRVDGGFNSNNLSWEFKWITRRAEELGL